MSCDLGSKYYDCPNGLFTGCCSHNACEQGICYDDSIDATELAGLVARDAATVTITKILARGESRAATTVTSTITITSTVYNHSTATSTAALKDIKELAAAVKSAIVPIPTIAKPTTVPTLTKASALSPSGPTVAPVINNNKNATASLKKSDPNHAGVVAGITIGSIAGAVMIGLLLFMCCRRSARSGHVKKKSSTSRSLPSTPLTPTVRKTNNFNFVAGETGHKREDTKLRTDPQPNDQLSHALQNPKLSQTSAQTVHLSLPKPTRLSQIHPAHRNSPDWQKQASPKSSHVAFDPNHSTRFYSSNEKLIRDASTASRNTSRGINSTSPNTGEYNYDPKSNVKASMENVPPANDDLDKRSLNSSIVQTPTSMIGPNHDTEATSHTGNSRAIIGEAIASPSELAPPVVGIQRRQQPPRTSPPRDVTWNENITDESHPDYQLPSQRRTLQFSRQVYTNPKPQANTASVWTNASLPYPETPFSFQTYPIPPTPPLPHPAPLFTKTTRKPLPNVPSLPDDVSEFNTDSNTNVNGGSAVDDKDRPLINDEKRKKEGKNAATTTESDVRSPTHEGQERPRKRMSLWSPTEDGDGIQRIGWESRNGPARE